MQLLGAFTTFLAAATCVSALPRGWPKIEKRAMGGVLICTGANATGDCVYQDYTLEDCHDLPADFVRNTNTFAPDGDDFYCWPRVSSCSDICKSPTGCTFGTSFYFDNPHKFNLHSVSWDKSLASFDCHKNTTTTA
ncbi:hypothetical protein GGR57DRAFT_496516 [Xylariaceae sp. FL1272]|nr:hypothetical protein GGR57DRAFT_496516 [Xylariaceae sp. FL1272]